MINPSDVDWSSLVGQAMQGHEAAFSQIYQNTVIDVYRTVHLLAWSSDDVDEIVQEVYVGLWKSLPGYDITRPFKPWLHGLVVRQLRSFRRSRWRRWRSLQRQSDSLLEASRQGADGTPAIDLHMDLVKSIDSLPLRLREVIVLRYFHGYALTEIAHILSIPASTARTRHLEALRRLRIDYVGLEGGAQKTCLPSEI